MGEGVTKQAQRLVFIDRLPLPARQVRRARAQPLLFILRYPSCIRACTHKSPYRFPFSGETLILQNSYHGHCLWAICAQIVAHLFAIDQDACLFAQ